MTTSPNPLLNSRRRFERRTYTPLVIKNPPVGESPGALDLAASVRALTISDQEFASLGASIADADKPTLQAMQSLMSAVSASAALASASQLAAAPTASLVN